VNESTAQDDKRSVRKEALVLQKEAAQLESVFNLNVKRKFDPMNEFKDKVKFAAVEGGSLTLFGLIKYDSNSDTFSMT